MMVVIIQNVSKPVTFEGINQYTVRINNGPVEATFYHERRKGLAECLRRAADAVDFSRKALGVGE